MSTQLVRQPRKLGFQLSSSPEKCKEGYSWFIVAVWDYLQQIHGNMLIV